MDANDNSGNAVNWTNNGSTPFTDLNIFGDAAAAAFDGTAQYLSSTSTKLALGNVDQSVGGWFRADNWTGGGGQELFGQYKTATPNRSFLLELQTTASPKFKLFTSADGSTFSTLDIATDTLVEGSWHHIAFVYTASNASIVFYLDGAPQVTTGVVAASLFDPSGDPEFSVAAIPGGGVYFGGSVQDFFFTGLALTQEDIKKIASARIDLTGTAASVGCDNQIWEATYKREDSKIKNTLSDGWLLDAKDDKIYADFGGASGDYITLKLYDGGLGATTVPAKCFDKTYTSTPPTTIAHGLASTPTSITVLHDDLATGKFTPLDPESFIKVDGTNISTAGFGALTIDATHPLRIIACAGATAIGSGASSGGAGWKVLVISSAYTASAGDDVLVDTTGTVTVTLPASPSAGDKVKVTDGYSNAATNNITVARNGSLIDAAAADFTINVDSVWTEFVYMDATRGWVTRV